jgi:hypothetical protein
MSALTAVIAAAIMHGTLNGTGGLALLVTRGGSDPSIGLTGAAGLAVLSAANVVLVLLRRSTLRKRRDPRNR